MVGEVRLADGPEHEAGIARRVVHDNTNPLAMNAATIAARRCTFASCPQQDPGPIRTPYQGPRVTRTVLDHTPALTALEDGKSQPPSSWKEVEYLDATRGFARSSRAHRRVRYSPITAQRKPIMMKKPLNRAMRPRPP
jgi:hypothetical protein